MSRTKSSPYIDWTAASSCGAPCAARQACHGSGHGTVIMRLFLCVLLLLVLAVVAVLMCHGMDTVLS